MADWQRHREPLRVTLTRTLSVAILAGAIVAPWTGGLRRWPVLAVLMLWPAFGGHWVDLLFLNWLRPRLPAARQIQRAARIALWFLGGIVLALGAWLTAMLLLARPNVTWLTWPMAGTVFVALELIAHAALHLRGRASFYNGLG
jgi:fatty acid desaturase